MGGVPKKDQKLSLLTPAAGRKCSDELQALTLGLAKHCARLRMQGLVPGCKMLKSLTDVKKGSWDLCSLASVTQWD